MTLTKILKRENGEEVKIVAELFTEPWHTAHIIENHILHRKNNKEPWSLCTSKINEQDKSRNNRSEAFMYVAYGEIIKVNCELLRSF